MKKEKPSSSELQGVALRETVRERMNQVLDIVPQDRSDVPIGRTFTAHLDELGVNWDIPRSKGEISSFLPSIYKSVQLAYLSTDRPAQRFSQLSTEDERWSSLSTVLQDPEMSQIFHENLWRPSTSLRPLRGVPFQYILRHQFGDDSIKGVDLGAGLHTALPFLNTPLYLNTDFSRKEEIAAFAKPVNITLGLGVDIQGREENNILWTKTGWVWEGNEEVYDRLVEKASAVDATQFPFQIADISDSKDSFEKIKKATGKKGQDPHFDFVTSSFVRYQLDDQQDFEHLVTSLLKEGGIWIDTGEKLIHDSERVEDEHFGVNVHQKIGNKLHKLGTPFEMADYGEIMAVNADYFNKNNIIHQE